MTSSQKPQKPLSLRTKGLAATRTALALGIPGLLAGQPLLAQDDAIVLDTLQIEERTADTNPYAEKGAPYKAKKSGDRRRVKDLAETPQTISVLTQTLVQESGKTDLKDILAAQPGITLGTGENGNAFGDRYIIRGHEARSDVFVDGLRDPGMTTRESFAVEQIEITKGPSATFAGRGSTGGGVNSITKRASTEYDFNKAQIGLGTDSYQRYSLDSNQRITDNLAVRANLLYSDKDVPDRGPAAEERKGAALSAFWQVSDHLDLVADYYYMDAADKPDLGTYILSNGRPVKDTPVYLQKQDFMESDVEVFTFRAGYDLADNIRLENATRLGTTDNGYVVTGTRGATRDASDPVAPGAATLSASTHQGWQEVDYFVNQTNLYLDAEIAGTKHQFVIGAEYSEHEVLNGVYDVVNSGATNCRVPGRGGVSAGYCFTDGNGNTLANIDNLLGREISKGAWDSDWRVDTLSVYLMDTIDLSERWSLFAGLRLDDFDYSNTVSSGGTITDYDYSDKLWNGHAGLVYTITDNGNVYASFSSASEINGGESDLGANCGYGGICGADPRQVTASEPEQTENIELGTKWNLFDDKLLATAAIFRITKDDVMESVGDAYESLGTLNTGENRVEGIEVSLAGNVTDQFSLLFGATLMESEVLDSIDPAAIGERLANFADDSLFLQLRYQVTPAIALGTTATYSSDMYAGQPDSAAGTNIRVPSYTVYDLFASYDFSEQLSLRLNIGNVTDKDYYLASYRSGAFTYIGDARNAHLTLSYDF
ncbi:MAG: TonB-dependent siderophore receptor [Pseudomonadota bacterium]|nr:TonB-dependent siderophore receptor [Pseudomonadota bacterium]